MRFSNPAKPFGLYVHLPFCDGKCPYCGFYSEPRAGEAEKEAYLAAIEHEARRRRALIPACMRPTTVYFGGGTPSLLSARQLDKLCGMVRTVFAPPPSAEWSVECNPGSLDAVKLGILLNAGVNRVSLGAQSLDDSVLRALGRRHDVAAVIRSAADIRGAGVLNWNIDLMACVPGVGEWRWRSILRRAGDLRPAHVSVYALTLEEGGRLAFRPSRRAPERPDDDRQLRMLRIAGEQLRTRGYRRYEISNYAGRGRRCRHHLDFWRGGDYIGLGASAVSRWGAERRRNLPDLKAYLAAWRRGEDAPHTTETLTPRQRAAERLVYGLRLTGGIGLGVALRAFGLPAGARDWPNPTLNTLAGHGLLEKRRGRIALTSRGLDLADAIALELWPGETEGRAINGRSGGS